MKCLMMCFFTFGRKCGPKKRIPEVSGSSFLKFWPTLIFALILVQLLIDFGSIFDRCWYPFGMLFGTIFDQLFEGFASVEHFFWQFVLRYLFDTF